MHQKICGNSRVDSLKAWYYAEEWLHDHWHFLDDEGYNNSTNSTVSPQSFGLPPNDHSEQVKQLKANSIQSQVSSLTRLVPDQARDRGPAVEPLSKQKLSKNNLEGLHIASRRGIRILICDYTIRLQEYAKDAMRVRDGSPSEDIDLEARYEKLPVSPILLGFFTKAVESLPLEIQRCVTKYSDATHSKMSVLAWLLETDVQEALTGHVERCSAWVQNDAADESNWTVHDTYLGTSYAYVQQCATKGFASRTRLSVKTNPAHAIRSKLLCTFALAAWVEMTERWYAMPEDPTNNLPCVSNICPLEIRALGINVRKEFLQSSEPIFDHCCATCGRLLCPSFNGYGAEEVGIHGPACQIRGRNAQWDSLPLCLLLWSKWTLHRTMLRGISVYDDKTNQLRFKGGPGVAPWLHYRYGTDPKNPDMPMKSLHGQQYVVDHKHPWWYCQWCYKYWIGGATERMPMRNRLEGRYTLWHQDLAYFSLHYMF